MYSKKFIQATFKKIIPLRRIVQQNISFLIIMFSMALTFIIQITLFESLAFSEPSNSINWLMEEPASLFDIGILRLRDVNNKEWVPTLYENLKDPGLTLSKNYSSVVYDLEKNRIIIEATFTGQPSEKLCAETLNKYLNIISPFRKEKDKQTAIYLLAFYFDHINYSKSNRPKDLDKNIVDIIDINVGIQEEGTVGSNKSIFCGCGIFSDTISFIKFGF